MNRYYVTFGQQYRTQAHPLNEDVDPDGYAVVLADSYGDAAARVDRELGQFYSVLHLESDFDASYYPLGELFTIS